LERRNSKKGGEKGGVLRKRGEFFTHIIRPSIWRKEGRERREISNSQSLLPSPLEVYKKGKDQDHPFFLRPGWKRGRGPERPSLYTCNQEKGGRNLIIHLYPPKKRGGEEQQFTNSLIEGKGGDFLLRLSLKEREGRRMARRVFSGSLG